MSFGLFISLSLISLLFIFGLVFILIPLRIKLRYFYQGENSYFWLEIKLWPGIRVYRRLFLKNKFKGEGKKEMPRFTPGEYFSVYCLLPALVIKTIPCYVIFYKKIKTSTTLLADENWAV